METLPINKFIFLLRILTLFIGTGDLVLTGYSFSEDTTVEEFLLSFIVIAFMISTIFLCGYYFTELLSLNIKAKYLDVSLHMLGGTFLIPTGVFMMMVATHPITDTMPGLTVTRTLSGLLGIQNGLIYLLIAILSLRTVPSPPSKYGEGLEWEDPLIETHEAKKVSFGTIMK